MDDRSSRTREFYALVRKLGEELVVWRSERGSTDGCTRLRDLVSHARVFPGLSKIALDTAEVAARNTAGLNLQQIKFTQDAVDYDEKWLRGYRLDGVPSFNDQAHIEWLVNELPTLMEAHLHGMTLPAIAFRMHSEGIELAPGVPIRRRGMLDYLKEAGKRADGLGLEFLKTNGHHILRSKEPGFDNDKLIAWLDAAKGEPTDHVPLRNLLNRLQADGIVSRHLDSRTFAKSLRMRGWTVAQKGGQTRVFGLARSAGV